VVREAETKWRPLLNDGITSLPKAEPVLRLMSAYCSGVGKRLPSRFPCQCISALRARVRRRGVGSCHSRASQLAAFRTVATVCGAGFACQVSQSHYTTPACLSASFIGPKGLSNHAARTGNQCQFLFWLLAWLLTSQYRSAARQGSCCRAARGQ